MRAELGDVGLAQEDRAGLAQPPQRHGVRLRDVVGEQPRAVGRGHPRDGDDLLRGERHAVQRTEVIAARERRVGRDGLGARLVQAREDQGIDPRVALGDAGGVRVEELDGARLRVGGSA